MNSLTQDEGNEFIQQMNEKSNDELLSIIEISHEYQPKAAEAAIKVALQRGIISNSEEIKKGLENTDLSISTVEYKQSSFINKLIAIIIFMLAAFLGSMAVSGGFGNISTFLILIIIAVSFSLMRFAVNLWKSDEGVETK